MIFIDRCISNKIATALKALRDDVRWLEDDFPPNAKDSDWLREVGTRGWLVITRDKKIRTRPGERQALLDNHVGAFCLTQKDNPKRWDIFKLVVGSLDEMEQIFADNERPFLYGVDRLGKFKRIPLTSPGQASSKPT